MAAPILAALFSVAKEVTVINAPLRQGVESLSM
jgi:hypothetical protein